MARKKANANNIAAAGTDRSLPRAVRTMRERSAVAVGVGGTGSPAPSDTGALPGASEARVDHSPVRDRFVGVSFPIVVALAVAKLVYAVVFFVEVNP